ncbi:MAG TPA: RsmE family RNA methyltransferase [Lacunisphaera sp.]|nr:RsmE family RNA methyltransferase [Lacunisphaera sp.]
MMPDFRAHAPDVAAGATEIRLSATESHHLVAVNRCSRGDPVIAFDGHGREWVTTCTEANKGAAILQITATRPAATRGPAISLAQSLPKGATMDEIVRQATEVGTVGIIPLLSERTQVHLDEDRADKKVGKWRATAIEAAKQCGNPWLPEISPIQKFDEWVGATAAYDLKLIASLRADALPLKTAVASFVRQHGRAPRHALWLVGPEGDFSPSEVAAALAAGFTPVTLGPLVLRSDTAALYALSILSNELRGP